jgi:bla regulator protein BlaR1
MMFTLTNLLDWVWRASWQGAVLVGLVLATQWLLGRRISARWRYNLWLLVLLRLVLPMAPSSRLSIYNLSTEVRRVGVLAHRVVTSQSVGEYTHPTKTNAELLPEEIAAVASEIAVTPTIRRAVVVRSTRVIHWPTLRQWLLIGWLGGAVAMLGRVLLASARLCALLRRYEPVSDPAVLELLETCKREMGVTQRPILLAADSSCVPALVGFLRPRLLMPISVLRDFDRRELRLIFLHELGHLRRRDVLINWIVAGLQILHWFNPVLWLAFARLRADRELACDELVLSIARQQERRAYGQTMIKLLQTLSRGTVLPGLVGILEGTHSMRRRISMIAQFDGKRRWSTLALLSVMGLAAISLTDGVHGEATEPATGAPTKATALDPVAPGAPGATAAPKSDPTAQPGGNTGGGRPPAVGAAYDRGGRPGASGGRYGGAPGGFGGYGAMPNGAPMRNPAGLGGDDKANAVAEQALKKVLADIHFDNIPLSDVVDYLRDAAATNIFVDWKVLEIASYARDVPVSLRLKNVPASEALRLALRNVGPDVSYSIENGIVVVGISDTHQTGVSIKAYDIGELVAGDEKRTAMKSKELVDLITETIANYRRTAVTVKAFNGKLIVTGDDATHKEIEKVLIMLHGDQELVAPPTAPATKDAGPIP